MSDFHPLRSLDEETKISAAWAAKNNDALKLAKEIPSAPIPNLDHLKMKDFQEVYEPSDDTVCIYILCLSVCLVCSALNYGSVPDTQIVSLCLQYLLLDGLQSEVNAGVFSKISGPIVLEIGCGSGAVSTFLASQLSQNGVIVYVTDINERALEVTKQTASACSGGAPIPIHLEAVKCDLVSALLPRLKHSVDCLIFNPPYVPTPDEEVGGTSIEASWAGGVNGRKVVDRAIPQMAQILARPNGVAYMITVDDNRPEEIAIMFRELGLDMRPIVRRRAHNEYLSVQKISWINDNNL